jgi:hypothetical protein
MSDKSKRHFWQFHLSSAVIMTILAGVVISLNFRPEQVESVDGAEFASVNEAVNKLNVREDVADNRVEFYGFPFRGRIAVWALMWRDNDRIEQTTFLVGNFVLNIVVGILIVFAGGFLSEFLIRRTRRSTS